MKRMGQIIDRFRRIIINELGWTKIPRMANNGIAKVKTKLKLYLVVIE